MGTAACVLSIVGFAAIPRETIVASFSTPLEGRNFSQRHNALMSLRALDGTVIEPRETLSFNRRIGSYSRDRGYRKAPVSFNGQLIDDWGGGVCQTSTTLYNAALLAGLDVLERTHHNYCPLYVPPGRDAAVAFPSIDLKILNPYPFPIRIHSFIDRDKDRVDVIAPHPLDRSYQLSAVVTQIQRPQTFYIGRPGGASRTRNKSKAGYQVAIYRVCGNERQIISYDDYPAMNRVVEFRP